MSCGASTAWASADARARDVTPRRPLPVRVTQAAYADLDAIIGYISWDSPLNAERVGDRLFEAMESLARFPERSPLAAEADSWGGPVRVMLVYRYRVLYLLRSDEVIVLRVLHGSMLPPVDPMV